MDRADTTGEEFSIPVRVYYEDTDAGGVVYYANYLRFMERARTEWLRSLGLEQDALREQDGVIFAVRSVKVEFLKPARFNDLLRVTVSVRRVGGASVFFDQRVRCDDVALAHAELKVACLDARSFMPRAIPARVVSRLNGAALA